MEQALIIVGQGIAGSILSLRLEERGIPFKLYDDPSHSKSSRIAAGLSNPVVLKRQKWVQAAELFLPEAQKAYPLWAGQLQKSFYHPISLEHIFHSEAEANDWIINSDKPHLKKHLGNHIKEVLSNIISPYGRGKLEGVFWVDTDSFIKARREDLLNKGLLISETWTADLMDEHPNSSIIYCNGHLARQTHPMLANAFSPTKGEVMIIKAENLPEDRILHAGVFTLPLGDKRFKIGATYNHKDLSENTSEDGLSYLKAKLESFYQGPYEVLEQFAAVRPNIKDRKPLMGRLSEREWLFNGMGSRGVLMAPYLSQHFLNHLLSGDSLQAQWHLNRFTSA